MCLKLPESVVAAKPILGFKNITAAFDRGWVRYVASNKIFGGKLAMTKLLLMT